MKTASHYPLNPLLIVDDEAVSLKSVALTLNMNGIDHVVEIQDGREVAPYLSQHPADLVLLDLNMPFISGEEILAMVQEQYPEIPVIVVTAQDEVDSAVRCMTKGAFDYMVKPVARERLVSGVRRALELKELQDQARLLNMRMHSGELQCPEAFSAIITKNQTMHSIFQYMESIAPSRQPVLVSGETGVGKELIVKAMHALSAPNGPLISVNVAGLDDNAFSDTLFGHLKGAFTGAIDKRQGLVEKATKGTLHLDEIGDLNLESQVKLLRLLQEQEYYPLGSDSARIAETRVIVSTNRDLFKLQESGQFRKDLYYRLSTHHIHIPPLRQRPDDIPLLLQHFIREAAQSIGKPPPTSSESLVATLSTYTFPGNVRELWTLVHDALSKNESGRLSLKDFNLKVKAPVSEERANVSPAALWRSNYTEGRLPTIEEATRQLIKEALRRCDNNQSEAARLLDISRQRLARNLKADDSI